MRYLEAKALRMGAVENKAVIPANEDKQEPVDAGPIDSPAEEAPAQPEASPKAREFAAENGVDLSQVTGTGASGRITVADVQAFIDAHP